MNTYFRPGLCYGAPVVLDSTLSQLVDHGLLRELIKRVQQSHQGHSLAASAGAEAAAAALDLPLLGSIAAHRVVEA